MEIASGSTRDCVGGSAFALLSTLPRFAPRHPGTPRSAGCAGLGERAGRRAAMLPVPCGRFACDHVRVRGPDSWWGASGRSGQLAQPGSLAGPGDAGGRVRRRGSRVARTGPVTSAGPLAQYPAGNSRSADAPFKKVAAPEWLLSARAAVSSEAETVLSPDTGRVVIHPICTSVDCRGRGGRPTA